MKKRSPLKNSRGMAMMLLLISMAMILALVGIVAASAGAVTAQADAAVKQDRCAVQVQSLGKSVQSLMELNLADPESVAAADSTDLISARSLQKVTGDFIDSQFLPFDPTEPYAKNSYLTLDSTDSGSAADAKNQPGLGAASITLRRTKVETAGEGEIEVAQLYLTVTCTLNGTSASDTAVYRVSRDTAVENAPYHYECTGRQ